MNEQDKIRLRHMRDAVQSALAFADGKSREMLEDDEMFAFALVRAIEIIGDAATKVSPETCEALPQIPWKSITGMRNKIVHDYFDIDYEVVWKTATGRLPELAVELKKVLTSGKKRD